MAAGSTGSKSGLWKKSRVHTECYCGSHTTKYDGYTAQTTPMQKVFAERSVDHVNYFSFQ